MGIVGTWGTYGRDKIRDRRTKLKTFFTQPVVVTICYEG